MCSRGRVFSLLTDLRQLNLTAAATGGREALLGVPAASSLTQHQQCRYRNNRACVLSANVRNNQVGRALGQIMRLNKSEGITKLMRAAQEFIPPAQERRLAAKESARRFEKRRFKMYMHWVMDRKQRGF